MNYDFGKIPSRSNDFYHDFVVKQSEIISSKISVSEKDINENSKSSDFYKWDSLAQLNIILEIEKKINMKIDASMMSELTSIKSIKD